MAAHWLAELARRLQHTTRFNAQILPDRNLQVLRHVPFKEWNQYNKMQVSRAQRFCCGSQSKDHTHGTHGSVMESHHKEYRNEFSVCISVAYYFPNSAWNKGIPHKSKCFPFFSDVGRQHSCLLFVFVPHYATGQFDTNPELDFTGGYLS